MNNVKSLSENIAKAVSETTKHVEFLAAAYPEIRTNLQTIAETLQVVHHSLGTVCELSEMQEKLIGRFGLFGHCYPVETYLNKTGLDILEKHENK